MCSPGRPKPQKRPLDPSPARGRLHFAWKISANENGRKIKEISKMLLYSFSKSEVSSTKTLYQPQSTSVNNSRTSGDLRIDQYRTLYSRRTSLRTAALFHHETRPSLTTKSSVRGVLKLHGAGRQCTTCMTTNTNSSSLFTTSAVSSTVIGPIPHRRLFLGTERQIPPPLLTHGASSTSRFSRMVTCQNGRGARTKGLGASMEWEGFRNTPIPPDEMLASLRKTGDEGSGKSWKVCRDTKAPRATSEALCSTRPQSARL